MKTENILEILLAAAIGYLTYLIMLPFLVPVFWAVVFVILFYPLYRHLVKRFRSKTAASLVVCSVIAVFLMVPVALMGFMLTNEAIVLYQWAEGSLKGLELQAHGTPVYTIPHLQKFISRYFDVASMDLEGYAATAVKEASGYLTLIIKGAVKSFAGFLFDLVLAFFSMYFLFKDGDALIGFIKDILPIPEKEKDKLINKSRVVISVTFYGGVVIGVVQGILGGLSFWFLGLPTPVFWGFVMFILSFLPGIGTALVWVPATLYLFVFVGTAKGVIMLLWSAVFVSLVDNVLRPYIVSGKTNQHPLLLFFSILGAVNVFGLMGIVAGPMIVCLAQTGIDIYMDTIKAKRSRDN